MSDSPVYSDDVLKAFVQGRLPKDEAEALRRAIAADKSLEAEIAVVKALLSAGQNDPERQAPSELEWRRLSKAIDQESGAANPLQTILSARLNLAQTAAAAVFAVMAWQIAVAPFLSDGSGADEAARYETASAGVNAGFAVQLLFAPGATEAQMRQLLIEIEGTIVSGPTQLGMYLISFESEAKQAAGLARLEDETTIVEHVQLPES